MKQLTETKVKKGMEIPVLQKILLEVGIFGVTDLLMNKPAKIDIENIEINNRNKEKKKNKDFVGTLEDLIPDNRTDDQKFKDKIHYLPKHLQNGTDVGFPVKAFQVGMLEILTDKLGHFYHLAWSKKASLSSITFLDDIVSIHYKKMIIDAQNANVGGKGNSGVPRIIVRPRFIDWSCILRMTIDENKTPVPLIVSLLNFAGDGYGIGARSKKGGHNFGCYAVDLKNIKAKPFNIKL